MDARRALLDELIDDAGLFPPALLSMEDATASHVRSREGEYGWMLGRFICPASRLRELLEEMPERPERPWRLSVILDAGGTDPWLERVTTDLLAARDFSQEAEGRAIIEIIEAKMPRDVSTTELRRCTEAIEATHLPGPVTPFLEVDPSASEEQVSVIADVRHGSPDRGVALPAGAKLRCGGATEDLLPSPGRVATFIDACRRAGVPFKATAGLHHPFRHRDPATGFMQHGFLNLLAAAALGRTHDLDVGVLEKIVSEEAPSSFILGPSGFAWKDLEATPEQVADTRRSSFVAYGSCSFEEPVEDLLAIGVLPA